MGNSKLRKSKFKASISQLLTFLSHMYNIHLGCWSQKMLQLVVCFTEKLKWNCCLVSLYYTFLFPSTLKFLKVHSIFVSLFVLISFTQMNYILYSKRLVHKQNLFCGYGLKIPTVFSIWQIIYWNANILWILEQCSVRSTFLYLFK